jgi:glycosyltransferase involved in cell wall biosynthesis
MNIGIVSTWFERGAAYVSKQYMNVLQNDEVYIYARGGEKYGINEKKWDKSYVTWDNKKSERTSDINIKQFEKWISENDIEIIFFNEQFYLEPVLIAKELGVIVGAYIDYYRIDSVETFGIYDFLICNTKRHYSVFKNYAQCFFVPWGTDINVFRPHKKEDISNKIVFFLSAGYSPERKGADCAIRAIYKLKNENCKLIIHTQVDLKELFPNLKETMDELILKDRLKIINKTVPAPGLYYLGDVYLYPSCLEGIGLTIAEALASGLPIITLDEPPMNEFGESPFAVRAKVDRYVSREDAYYWPISIVNEDSLSECMRYFIDNINLLDTLKANARNYAVDKLNWEVNAAKVEGIFHSVKSKELTNEIIDIVKKHDKKNASLDIRLNNYKQNLIKILNKINVVDGRVAIYCAGKHTQELLDYIVSLRINIVGIIDKKTNIKAIHGIKVFCPDEINILNPEYIIVSSYKYQNEIEKELINRYKYDGIIIKLYDEKDEQEFYSV